MLKLYLASIISVRSTLLWEKGRIREAPKTCGSCRSGSPNTDRKKSGTNPCIKSSMLPAPGHGSSNNLLNFLTFWKAFNSRKVCEWKTFILEHPYWKLNPTGLKQLNYVYLKFRDSFPVPKKNCLPEDVRGWTTRKIYTILVFVNKTFPSTTFARENFVKISFREKEKIGLITKKPTCLLL